MKPTEQTTEQTDRMLTVEEVAAMIGVHPRTILRWIHAETHPLPALSIGTKPTIRIPARPLSAWLSAHHLTPGGVA